MKVLVARKEYIYYYLEYMFSNIHYIEVGDRGEEFIKIATSLDLEVLAVGNFESSNPHSRILTIEEFAQMYFQLRDLKQVVDEEQEHLNEYCLKLEEFLAKK